jgi:2-polyprenyl-3-methyl-5-hydroxy-6-metoxy-1,4-benzoquinol methylase
LAGNILYKFFKKLNPDSPGEGGESSLNDTPIHCSYINVQEVRGTAKDERLLSRGVNTVLESTLDEIIDKNKFNGKRILEIGPKFGYHSKWIDKNLSPQKLVMLELSQKDSYVNEWISELSNPHEVIYESLLESDKLLLMERFDLIFFTGVLYHNVEHFKILNILRRLLKDDGTMIFQTSINIDFKEPVIFINWREPGQLGSYAYPSKSALFLMLAMTGWDNILHFVEYRPHSNTVLLTCQKSKELFLAYDKLPFGGSKI